MLSEWICKIKCKYFIWKVSCLLLAFQYLVRDWTWSCALFKFLHIHRSMTFICRRNYLKQLYLYQTWLPRVTRHAEVKPWQEMKGIWSPSTVEWIDIWLLCIWYGRLWFLHKFRVLYSGMILSFLCISYGDRYNVGVADYLKGKLVAEYEFHSESVINSMYGR